jgi:hypothetical protein
MSTRPNVFPRATKDERGKLMAAAEPSYGTFEGCPALWTPYEAWVLYVRTWRKIHPAELMGGARPMSKAEFIAAFAQLPAMPSAAFQAGG